MQSPPRSFPKVLFNEDGVPFGSDLEAVGSALASLANAQRITYRNENAAAIAAHSSPQILIVAGPGAGKSHLFMGRIRHWLKEHPDASIYVSSFVRKLVKDLESEVKNSDKLNDADRQRVTVTTLHTLARSVLERNHGTAEQPFQPRIKIISGEWQAVVWNDVLAFHNGLSAKAYPFKSFARQFYTEEFDGSEKWTTLRDTYSTLSRFYNAVGFADLIVMARQALEENPELNSHLLWIIDEFQDFNPAEEHLIRTVVTTARGVLIAGDDEQALYQELKNSLPEIIISYYERSDYANAMLPYCTRCSYHVCLAASAFIARHRVKNAIAKIYLPLEEKKTDPKVQVVTTAAPSSAVDYIAKFLEDHHDELEAHIKRMEEGDEVDPFLLILSPAKRPTFYQLHGADTQLQELVGQWSAPRLGRSQDYRRVATYGTVGWDQNDNFATRKILEHEGVSTAEVHELIRTALAESRSLADVTADQHREILDKCRVIANALEREDITEPDRVGLIEEVFPVADREALASELEQHPLHPLTLIVADEGEEAIETADTAAPVELLTMVGAKGLSAQHVIVIGCDDVNMKHVTALTFFVALTRARRSLHLITSLKARGTTPHKFILDLPEDLCEYTMYRKTGRKTDGLSNKTAFEKKVEALARAGTAGGRRAKRA